MIMKKALFTVIVLLLLIAFGVSAFMVGSYLLEGKEQEERYDELASIAANAQTTTQAPETTVCITIPIRITAAITAMTAP